MRSYLFFSIFFLAQLGLVACNPLSNGSTGTLVSGGGTATGSGVTHGAATSKTWEFDNAAEYTASSSSELSVNSASNSLTKLTVADLIDNSTAAAAGDLDFSHYTSVDSAITVASNKLLLSSTTGKTLWTTQAELNSDWDPAWANLVSYWKMDNSWNDSKGTNHGAASFDAAFSTSSRIGTHAGIFDGTGDLVTVPNDASLNLTTGFTVSAWVFVTDAATRGIVEKTVGGVTSTQYLLYIDSGLFRFTVNDGGNKTVSSSDYSANGLNRWYHVVGVHTGAAISLYVDGVLQASTAAAALAGGAGALYLGNLGGGASAWSGRIDDVAIWNTALSATQIAAVYHRQSANYSGGFTSRIIDGQNSSQDWTALSFTSTLPWGKPMHTAAESGYGATTTDFSNGLIGLWHLDEAARTGGAANDFLDSSGNGNHGEGGNAIVMGAQGKIGNAPQFLNSAGQSIAIADSASLDSPETTGQYTMAAWIHSASNSFKGIMGRDVTRFGVIGVQKLCLIDPNICTAANAIKLNTWQHVAVTVSRPGAAGTAGTVTFYVNGALFSTHPGQTINSLSSAAAFTIGDWNWGDFWSGAIDEAGFWNRTLTAAEITELYRRGSQRTKFQVRTCDDSTCSANPTFVGVDGTNSTYFDESRNTNSGLLTGSTNASPFALLWTTLRASYANFLTWMDANAIMNKRKQYLQYRTILESDEESTSTLCDTGNRHSGMVGFTAGTQPCMPDLTSLTMTPATRYSTTNPSVYTNNGMSFYTLSTFTATLGGGGCAGTAKYQLSLDKVTWYYWGGAAWIVGTNYATASDAATVNTNIASFASVGTGTLYVRAFLPSNGTQACEIDSIAITGGT